MEEQGSQGLYINGIEYRISYEQESQEFSFKVESYEIKYDGRSYFTEIDKFNELFLSTYRAKSITEGISKIAQEIIWNSKRYK